MFNNVLKKISEKGEKTGWTYIDIPQKMAAQIKPGYKKSFRIKGKIDDYNITGLALLPMGEGNFILAINGSLRKAIKKIHGALVKVELEEDSALSILSPDMIACLQDEPEALNYFNSLPGSHQNWFSNWVKSAKTTLTSTRRIAAVVKACQMKLGYSELIKSYKGH